MKAMQVLKDHTTKGREKIGALSVRERALVLLSVLACMYLLWDLVYFSPVSMELSNGVKTLQITSEKISAKRKEQQMLQLANMSDPDRDLKQRIEKLQTEQSELESSLEALSLALVPVDQLAVILQEVLAKTGQLQLKSLTTLPVERIELMTDENSDYPLREEFIGPDSDESESLYVESGVYKHSVLLTLEGTYFNVVQYITLLESMEWRFYWDQIDYEKIRYPKGRYQLKVFTLSTDEGFLGV